MFHRVGSGPASAPRHKAESGQKRSDESLRKHFLNNSNQSHDEAVATDITKSVNHHFKREGRLMIWFVIGVPVILLICALVFGPALLTLAGR